MIGKKRISVILAWTLAGMGMVAFFLPWVRPAAGGEGQSPLEVANRLTHGESSFFETWIGMEKEEWQVFAQRPTEGLSGFQILLLESAKGIQAEDAQAWLDAVFGDGRAIGRALCVFPVLIMLLTAAFMSPRKPLRQLFGVGAGLLFAFYLWSRWRLDVVFTQRIIAEMDIAYGMWITLYLMLALAIVAGLKFLSPKTKW